VNVTLAASRKKRGGSRKKPSRQGRGCETRTLTFKEKEIRMKNKTHKTKTRERETKPRPITGNLTSTGPEP